MDKTLKNEERTLRVTRLVEVSREKIYRCWTEPELMVKWFTPSPWGTKSADLKVEAGGRFNTVMLDPDGKEYPNEGVFLEVVPNEKLVFTDAFTEGWFPSGKPFMVATLELTEENGKTRYTAYAKHWTQEACEEHEKMGFVDGWNKALDQLLEVAATL